MRPCTDTAPIVGFVMPATSFNAVLLPEPLRPTSPKVLPAGTRKEKFESAVNVSSGLSSPRMLRFVNALLSVANWRLPYRR